MKIEKNLIFSTNIFVSDNVLDQKYIDSMKEDILKSSIEKQRVNWQSNPNLHKEKKYEQLTVKVIDMVELVIKDYKWIYEKFEITNMWANILKPGEMHRPHTHSNNILSGVYYVDTNKDDVANIQFYDPRPQSSIISPDVTEYTRDNAHIWMIHSIINRMIIFPSWLQHYVPTNISKTNRISIAFNIMLKGKVGDSKDLQSSTF